MKCRFVFEPETIDEPSLFRAPVTTILPYKIVHVNLPFRTRYSQVVLGEDYLFIAHIERRRSTEWVEGRMFSM